MSASATSAWANQARSPALNQALKTGNLAVHGGLLPFLEIWERQRLIVYSKLVEQVKDIGGMIVEVGVHLGGSLLSLASQEAMLHPYDLGVRVFGFDTFLGFPEISERDDGEDPGVARVVGGYGGDSVFENVQAAIALFDRERPYGNRPMIELIKGDICQTVPEFAARFTRAGAESNSALVIKLLHLACDLYEPTMVALQHLGRALIPGAIVITDEWSQAMSRFPGGIRAVKDYFGAELPLIQRFDFRQPGGWFVVTPELFSFIQRGTKAV